MASIKAPFYVGLCSLPSEPFSQGKLLQHWLQLYQESLLSISVWKKTIVKKDTCVLGSSFSEGFFFHDCQFPTCFSFSFDFKISDFLVPFGGGLRVLGMKTLAFLPSSLLCKFRL